MNPARLLALAASLIAALGLAACGGIGPDEDGATESVQQPSYLRQAVIERQPEDSAARAFLLWWRALQFDNPVEASRYYSRALRMTPRRMESQLAYGPGTFGFGAAPKIVETIREEDRATVQVLVTKVLRAPNGRVDKVRTARGFNFVREGGEWKLSDNLYVERLVFQAKAVEKLLRSAPKQKPSEGAKTGDG